MRERCFCVAEVIRSGPKGVFFTSKMHDVMMAKQSGVFGVLMRWGLVASHPHILSGRFHGYWVLGP